MEDKKLIIFTAPSGAGKTTIVRHLLRVRSDLAFSISACTRSPRYGEVNGLDYYFLSADKFRSKIAEGDFLEWQMVYENQYYGTLRSEVERLWALGKHVVFDIDVKGAWEIKKQFKKKALSIFVKPPSFEELRDRLINRKTEDEKSLRKRIARVQEEMTYEHKFDVSLVNSELEVALKQAEELVDDFILEKIKVV
ncbi:MAG: guanylate kinase [Aureispira sp.]|nr:guanylate kinase [Aureispira sp.]